MFSTLLVISILVALYWFAVRRWLGGGVRRPPISRASWLEMR